MLGLCEVDTGSRLPFSLGTGSGREWGSPTDVPTARRPCFPPQNRAPLGDPCGTRGGVCARIAPSQTTNSCPAAGHRGGLPSAGVLWSGQCCRCFRKLDGLASSFLHKTPPSPAAQPSATLNGRPMSTPLYPSIRTPARRPLGAFRSSRPSDMGSWGYRGRSRNDSQWPRARRGQEDWFSLCALGPHGKGEDLGNTSGGCCLPRSLVRRQGPRLPVSPPVTLSMTSASFAVEFSMRKSTGLSVQDSPESLVSLAALRNVLRVSMWACACTHQP